MVTAVIQFHVKEEFLSNFNHLVESVKENLPTLDDCSAVETYQQCDDAQRFIFTEHWTSPEAHEAYLQTLIEDGTMNQVLEWLVEPPKTAYFNVL